MLSVEDAFKKFRSRLELNDKEQKNVSSRHNEMRDALRAAFDVENDFLTGSYKRYTKTKPLQDVDFLCVLGEKERFRRKEHPSKLLDAFVGVLANEYGSKAVTRHDRSVEVDFGIVVDAEDNTDYRESSAWKLYLHSRSRITARFQTVPIAIGSKPIRKYMSWPTSALKIAMTDIGKALFAWPSIGTITTAKRFNHRSCWRSWPWTACKVHLVETSLKSFNFSFRRLPIESMKSGPIRLGFGDCDKPRDDPLQAETPAKEAIAERREKAAANARHLTRIGKNGEALQAWRTLFGPKFPLS